MSVNVKPIQQEENWFGQVKNHPQSTESTKFSISKEF